MNPKGHYQLIPLNDRECWNKMLKALPWANPFHTVEWAELLQQHFPRLQPQFFRIERAGETVGLFPCYLFRPVPGIRMLHSLHWNLPGGPLFREPSAFDTPSATTDLVRELQAYARQTGITEVLIHTSPFGQMLARQTLVERGFIQTDECFTHILDIRAGREAVWTAYNKRVRGAVRKAEKNGVRVRLSSSEEDMRTFYRQYLAMMRHFGSTPKPSPLLRGLQQSRLGHLVVAELDGQIIGGLLFLHAGAGVTLWVETSLPEYLHLRTNNAVIDFIVEWACEQGCDWVDFGASPPKRPGLVAFKEEWQAVRHDFISYRWVSSPVRLRVWEALEPRLRTLYGWLQRRLPTG